MIDMSDFIRQQYYYGNYSTLKNTIAILMCENKDFIMNIGIIIINKKLFEKMYKYNYPHAILPFVA